MEYTPPPLFKQGPSAKARLMLYVALSVVLLVVDARYAGLEVLRKAVGTVIYPLQRMASGPSELVHAVYSNITTFQALQARNATLEALQLEQTQRLHQLDTVLAENAKLRRLVKLAAALQVKERIPAEVISDASDPFTRKIVLGKGFIQGVRDGLPVVDEQGLIGQVTRSFPSRAEVSLITDKQQVVPVEVLRNGLRSVAYGGEQTGTLELRFLAINADIQANDMLVSSGLDGIYPRGIPVAKVLRVERNPKQAFASVICLPLAGVERHRFVLVLDTYTPPTPAALKGNHAQGTGPETPQQGASATTTGADTFLPLAPQLSWETIYGD